MVHREIIVIGAGPAGMAAAVRLSELGYRGVLVLEKAARPGGVLRQCIHTGFGLERFHRNYTGPEYSALYEDLLEQSGAMVSYETTVLSVRQEEGALLILARGPEGDRHYRCEAAILATGCREKSRGALGIPGTRPAGIFSAGTAQGFINLHHLSVGTRAVIIGSGDIGLIMARRLTLTGCQVLAVVEKEAVCGGLPRNRKECLEDYQIPLLTRTEVTEIGGQKRVEYVIVRNAEDEETRYDCDTVILSAGLIPEDGMVEGEPEGLFYCGNALYVHDLVDHVSESGEAAALDAAGYLLAKGRGRPFFSDYESGEVERRRKERRAFLDRRKKDRLREEEEAHVICTVCPNGCRIRLSDFSGGLCPRGEIFARNEVEHPHRVLTAAVRVQGTFGTVSVRTERPIPLQRFSEGMQVLKELSVSPPVKIGQVLVEDLLGTGTAVIATSSVMKE